MSAIEKEQEYKLISSFLFEKFNKIALTPKETAAILGRTEAGLKKDREEEIGIPFTRLNRKEKGKPLYSITAIARTIVDNQIKIFN
ncbi:hypothetical protein CPG37_04425 [Malaciobacter canalis]|uniref:DNA-binding protein n=1 Tax=Malaciobacter canalis TaxID=1912871 RepID=A0ABX4LQS8_9BACT|nr:hypothetical protein [Malaciobacter canalis]PHO10297.1 hypothetical protein CPG37_04425 [Malaciobacter canalis]QEE32402.1 hypothetical protein ACAN_0913 [Malaciobacter canalis]